ncbi:AbrB/MazE/SpoVT family DNA-binding domain-containing protein [Pseudothauera rhizosphaerae]|uniref:AbrB/MazE/SpoVT family DNA-binding domain-containing protein n=1 Tax=Pseudothauera rhizosphaerae TaxID=2565932 RepID=A0A4V3W9Q3_9RHOO|nr:AbrB/MazE/SpoVT family DNA-binding domain-containing protein [Pseudothauera rhizosphaerae]THF56244.1 AbrB/MazE/SpoVT family DNA-binding domain-containing protein [Pseudothauera rhizosphaerae]
MPTATTTLSSKGQIVIPKEIREALHWEAGTQLTLVSSASGVTLKAIPKKTGRRFADLIGSLKHDGPPLSTEALCQPVEYGADEDMVKGQAR